MAGKPEVKKVYVKPEVRKIKLSLAELTLGTNCFTLGPDAANPGCTDLTPTCSI